MRHCHAARLFIPLVLIGSTSCSEPTSTMSIEQDAARSARSSSIAVELAAPPGTSNANDVTSGGLIVGGVSGGCNSSLRPVTWPTESSYQELPLLSPWCNGTANFVNEGGTIIGRLNLGTTSAVAVRWTPNGAGYSVDAMGALPDGSSPDLKGLNAAGEAIANHNGQPGSRPYWWSAATGWQPIPIAAGAANCYAEGLDDLGEISGQCDGTAQYWSSHTAAPQPLPRLAGYDGAHSATALNTRGVAVGYADRTVSGKLVQAGVRWTQGAAGWTPETLPNLGAGGTQPWDVNDAGVAVGASWVAPSKNHAFLLPPGGSMRDLGSLGTESWAFAITPSSAASVVVVGVSAVGTTKRATMWRP